MSSGANGMVSFDMGLQCISRCLDNWQPIVDGSYETVVAPNGSIEWDILTDFDWNGLEHTFPWIEMTYAIHYNARGNGSNNLVNYKLI